MSRHAPRAIWSWALYDWANSAFTTLVVTFIYSTYFTQAMAPDEVTGTEWWSRAVGVSAILTAVLSPILGAAADRAGARKRFLGAATALCVVATTLLAFVPPSLPNAALVALVVYVVADVSFETGYTFYNAFLPVIAAPERIGRVSGYGWGLGYVGGLACLGIALVGFVRPEVPWFGLSTAEQFNVRATNLLVAIWFLVFALPLFLFVPERRLEGVRLDVRGTFRELGATLRAVGRYREAAKFLVARLVFNDGLVTIFAFGGIYAAGTFGMTIADVIAFGIVINVAAGLGAVAFGFLDDRIGGKRTILVTLGALTLGTALAVWAPDRTWFWLAGIVIGLFVGPNQSASRSLMGRFVPERRQAEFFGFFQFSGKVTSFLGPVLLGWVAGLFDSQRAGVAALLVFFVVGAALLLGVNERAGIAAARDDLASPANPA
ncbi:MAG: MFS transporter [Gemmatimonadales bacterium]